MAATMMMITMRGVAIMMRAQDPIQNFIFQNSKEECVLMTCSSCLAQVVEPSPLKRAKGIGRGGPMFES